MEGSSFPIGGESTHAVLTGHTGLNTAKLFTDLTELEEGDLFYIRVLGNILAYKVCDINVVKPENTSKLKIQKGKDLVTLVTCTPYGVNSHRLLVTGERTEFNEEEYEAAFEQEEDSHSQWMEQYKKAVLIGLGIVAVGGTILFIANKIRNHGQPKELPKEKTKEKPIKEKRTKKKKISKKKQKNKAPELQSTNNRNIPPGACGR